MFSDPTLILGAIVGLVMGSFGYVLFRFAWRPARQYRLLKKQIGAILIPGQQTDELKTAERDRLRRLAVELHMLTTDALPHWYRLALQRRGVDVEEAARQLQSLVNCREPMALHKRRQAVCRALGLGATSPRAGRAHLRS